MLVRHNNTWMIINLLIIRLILSFKEKKCRSFKH